MKLSENTLISPEKLTDYLLVFKKRNDKSQWLAKLGYTIENWKVLEYDLRKQILSLDVVPIEKTEYGQLYEIKGKLTGPNGISLSVCTNWMIETETGTSKFITMYPDKKE
jgi:hypothetical protein